MNSPVIITGMHRSGTTLVAHILESSGLFIGAFKDDNCESHFFITINDWILRISGGSWDNPGSFDRIIENDVARRIVIHHIRNTLNSLHRIRYSGLKYFRKHPDNTGNNIFWGWKDPRNTITLPIWLDLYPEARIIHVCRHGVDVANSLKIRQKRWFQRTMAPPSYRRLRYKLRPFGGHYLRSVGFNNYDEGLKLWTDYMRRARATMSTISNRSMEIRFEDLLREPEKNIQFLLDFCHLNKDSRKLSETLEALDVSRAFAYKKYGELVDFASTNAEILAKFGY